MFPKGAHPTQIGVTDSPVRPRGRLEEGPGTSFTVMDHLSQYPLLFPEPTSRNGTRGGTIVSPPPLASPPLRSLRGPPRRSCSPIAPRGCPARWRPLLPDSSGASAG